MRFTTDVVLIAAVRGNEGICPACSKSSTRVHSRYQRTLTDAPVTGRVSCLGERIDMAPGEPAEALSAEPTGVMAE